MNKLRQAIKGKGCLIALVAVPLLLWALLRMIYPSFSWSQSTSIIVETPNGASNGRGVVRVMWKDGFDLFPDAPHFTYSYSGEATVVDLGDGKYLFALIKDAQRLGLRVFGQNPLPQGTDGLIPSAKMTNANKRAGPSQIEYSDMPLLVTFGDINDPASVKRVDPNDMDASFGMCQDGSGLKSDDAPWRSLDMLWSDWMKMCTAGMESGRFKETMNTSGRTSKQRLAIREFEKNPPTRDNSNDCHKLQSITLEITNEPITTGKVESVLGWLSAIWPNKLDGNRYETSKSKSKFANSLSANSFSTEVSK